MIWFNFPSAEYSMKSRNINYYHWGYFNSRSSKNPSTNNFEIVVTTVVVPLFLSYSVSVKGVQLQQLKKTGYFKLVTNKFLLQLYIDCKQWIIHTLLYINLLLLTYTVLSSMIFSWMVTSDMFSKFCRYYLDLILSTLTPSVVPDWYQNNMQTSTCRNHVTYWKVD